MKFLALSTSAHRYTETGMRTGVWLGEYTHFYDVITEAGHEEKLARRADAVPLSLEDKLAEEAGDYSTAAIPMTKHVVVDGTLVTGQNPTSAAGVGEAVLGLRR